MIEFLNHATMVMAGVSVALLLINGFIRPFRKSKALYFICGETCFATAITGGSLLLVPEVGLFAFFWLCFWFIMGSLNFIYATFFLAK